MRTKTRRQESVQPSGRLSVQCPRDPTAAVQKLDRRNVQLQVFRASMKLWLDAGLPFIVGDSYHARAIVIPLARHWRHDTATLEKEAREKFREALELLVRD